jgi:putative transposase
VKSECIRPGTPQSLEDALRLVTDDVRRSNEERLHRAIGYVTPADRLAGRDRAIFAARRQKLEAAQERRQKAHEAVRSAV